MEHVSILPLAVTMVTHAPSIHPRLREIFVSVFILNDNANLRISVSPQLATHQMDNVKSTLLTVMMEMLVPLILV